MNTTRRSILLSLFLLIFNCGFAQETELDRRNGFKDIKMASNIDSVKGAIFKKDFKEKGDIPAKLYEIEHPEYETIGEVKVNRIEIRTYKNLIYEILVITDKDQRLMKGMEKALGKPGYNLREDSYNWAGKNVSLKFTSYSKNQLQLLYGSKIIYKMMTDDKKQKIKDISSDF